MAKVRWNCSALIAKIMNHTLTLGISSEKKDETIQELISKHDKTELIKKNFFRSSQRLSKVRCLTNIYLLFNSSVDPSHMRKYSTDTL